MPSHRTAPAYTHTHTYQSFRAFNARPQNLIHESVLFQPRPVRRRRVILERPRRRAFETFDFLVRASREFNLRRRHRRYVGGCVVTSCVTLLHEFVKDDDDDDASTRAHRNDDEIFRVFVFVFASIGLVVVVLVLPGGYECSSSAAFVWYRWTSGG
jgi:hypothetical protein